MAASILKPVFSLAQTTRIFIRTAAVNSTATDNAQLKPWSEIPGPSSLPIIGQMHHFLPKGEFYDLVSSPLDLFVAMHKKYGPILKMHGMFGSADGVMLFDPESASHILRSENWHPVRPGFESLDYYRRNKSSRTVYGLLTDHGEVWKQFRSTVNPVLLQPKTMRLYTGMIDEVARDMITRMKSIRGEDNRLKGKFDMEMNLWSLESIGLIALGRRLNCFNRELAEDSPEKRLIRLVHDIFKIANELDFKPNLWRYIPTRKFKKAMKLYEEQENTARYFVDIAMEELKQRGDKTSEDEKGVLEKLLEINKDVAVIMACDMLFAGVDTTSNTITATMYLLAKNQDKQDNLREEVFSQSEKRPYLRACLKESLRMMPVVAGNARILSKDHSVLGYSVPKGTMVSFMHQCMSMMEDQYPRPKEYIPERWIVPKDDPLYHGNAHPFAHMPFGFGVRSCLGRRIAELELETFLGRIIQNFKIEWDGPPVNVSSASLNYITGPFNFVFKDVK